MFVFVFVTFSSNGFSQVKNIGTPFIRNYDRTEYKAGLQTWMISDAPNGLMYFANNDGMMEFDGFQWRLYRLPGESVVRSVLATSDNRIYAGGFNEIGYFSPNEKGKLNFTTLQHIVPEQYRDFGEVWKIYDMPQGIIFQSFEQLMIFRDNSITVVRAPELFHFSFLVNGELYINDEFEGLHRLAGERLTKVPGTDGLKGQLVWAMLPKGNNMLIATTNNGIFEFNGLGIVPWENPAGDLLRTNQVYCGITLSENTYAFGSIQDGLIICDTAGTIKQHINIGKGLQNNTILSLQVDQYANLWLGLDLSLIHI